MSGADALLASLGLTVLGVSAVMTLSLLAVEAWTAHLTNVERRRRDAA